MDIFNVLTVIGGLCLFLFGMNLMGQALERRAGGKLRSLLDKMTGSVFAGFLTGLGITAIIQSSSATTVMVVGFVNSGLMTLRQAINVIMGANVGTTVTAWLLSLGGIDSGNFWIKLLKPSSFTPVLALIGIIYYMFCKDNKKKDTGMILLGFATLMFGMETMSGAVAGLKDVPAFTNLFVAFQNPLLGVLAGALLTAIIQSSSASVGILQALAVTGSVSYAAAIPIIMGQNIGTTVTAMLSSIGTNKNARRAAVVHLLFNVIGVVVLLTVFCIVRAAFAPALLDESATMAGIAVTHSVFNVLCTAMLCAGMLVLCRVFWIAADQSYAASAAAQTVSETVLPIQRGNFYDRIGRPLTGVTPRWYALCIPGDSSYATLFPFVPFAQQAQLYARRNSITPFLIEVEDDLSANGVFMVADARRYLPTPIARHLIGYLDGDGHGMTGLEKAYDDLLAAAGDAQAVLCTTTARGSVGGHHAAGANHHPRYQHSHYPDVGCQHSACLRSDCRPKYEQRLHHRHAGGQWANYGQHQYAGI